MKTKKFEYTVMGNEVLEGDGFYISYRGNTSVFGGMFAGDDNGQGETALSYKGEYKILNGDFREEYEKIANKGLKECLKFFKSKEKECKSTWSN